LGDLNSPVEVASQDGGMKTYSDDKQQWSIGDRCAFRPPLAVAAADRKVQANVLNQVLFDQFKGYLS